MTACNGNTGLKLSPGFFSDPEPSKNQNMKKYRTLKELPGIPAGTLAPYEESDEAAYFPKPDGSTLLVTKNNLNKYPDFFEEVIDYKAELIAMNCAVYCYTDQIRVVLNDSYNTEIFSNDFKRVYEILKGGQND